MNINFLKTKNIKMIKLIRCIFSIILLVYITCSCSKEPVSIFTFEIDRKIYNADDLFVWCNLASVYKNEEIVFNKYRIGYKLSDDFSFVCLDSSLTNTRFETASIEVQYFKHVGDSTYEYELENGQVDLKILERKGELKGTFSFRLVNKSDSTEKLDIEDGFFHAQLSYSNIEL